MNNAFTKSPGSAKVSELAIHWCVCTIIARKIIDDVGLKNISLNSVPRYAWADIWSFEGAGFVHPTNWEKYKQPLLDTATAAKLDPRKRCTRSWARYIRDGKIPAVQLRPSLFRVRLDVYEAVIDSI